MTSLTLRNYCIEDVFNYAVKFGISGIEWGISDQHLPLKDKDKAQKILKLSNETKVDTFSLGSYCYMDTIKNCVEAVETASMICAPIIRIWAGKKSPSECTNEYLSSIVDNTIIMADYAKKYNIKLGFEYHHHSLTETPESAIDLIKRVNRNNVGLYWQPKSSLSAQGNLLERNKVLPYCVGNIHIQNYTAAQGYKLLSEIEDNLYSYFSDIKGEKYNVMIEFTRDSSPENLLRDVAALDKIVNH